MNNFLTTRSYKGVHDSREQCSMLHVNHRSATDDQTLFIVSGWIFSQSVRWSNRWQDGRSDAAARYRGPPGYDSRYVQLRARHACFSLAACIVDRITKSTLFSEGDTEQFNDWQSSVDIELDECKVGSWRGKAKTKTRFSIEQARVGWSILPYFIMRSRWKPEPWSITPS